MPQQRFFAANADVLERLDPVQRRAVRQSVSNGMLEGWEPDRAALVLLVARAAGDISGAQYRELVIARAKRGTRARMGSAYTEEQAIAGMVAGHRMAGMEPTGGDIAAARRGFGGESTAQGEVARILAEIEALRAEKASAAAAPGGQSLRD